jgi:hypothetical protein
MTNTQDNGDWFDRETGEVTAMVPVETETVMVREDTAPTLVDPNNLPDFDNMDAGFSMAQQYVKFTTPGQKARGMYLGLNEFKTPTGEQKRIAIFQNKQGVWANAGDNLLGQVEHLPKHTSVEVTYTGDKTTKRGFTVKVFEVRLLNEKPAPVIPTLPNPVPAMRK